MYGIAEFLWGAVLDERNAAWYSKQATNNDAGAAFGGNDTAH